MPANTKPTAPGRPGGGVQTNTPVGGTEMGPQSDGKHPATGAGKGPSTGYYTVNPSRGNGAPVIGGKPSKGPQSYPMPRGKV